MNRSHPERWLYGGVLVRIDWRGGNAKLSCWDGVVRVVEAGDTVVALQTPAALTPVEVEHPVSFHQTGGAA